MENTSAKNKITCVLHFEEREKTSPSSCDTSHYCMDDIYLAMSLKCTCGNTKERHFWRYEPYGFFCRKCKTEWLADTYIDNNNSPEVLSSYVGDIKSRKLSRNSSSKNEALHSSQTRIQDTTQLKIGDHIAFQRSYIIWHHCIMSEVFASKTTVEVMHWQKRKGKIKIRKQVIDVEKEDGDLYRIDYASHVEKASPVDLVLARGSSRLHQTGYQILTDNCESFATFCKTGIIFSHQINWLLGKLRGCLFHCISYAYSGMCILVTHMQGAILSLAVGFNFYYYFSLLLKLFHWWK